MITTVVTFKIPQDMTRDQWFSTIEAVAPHFQNIPGLIRKHFLYSAGVGGGVYLWETKVAAEACYSDAWRESIRRVAVSDPEIAYYETQVVVDNERNEIRTAA